MSEHNFDPNLIAEIRKQVLEEIKSEDERKKQEARRKREEADDAHKSYAEKMYASSDPWVEVIGWVDTPNGVRAELDWNDAFIAFLRDQGITGTSEEQVIQKYVALLLRNISDDMEGLTKQAEYE